jgi:diguanylate cyclase (GGDEF)-like protein/PAS domain S-box-containing protein
MTVLMLSWGVVVAASLLWDWRQIDEMVVELARREARSHFEKDVIYRRWAALQGGVYVAPSAETPPNPYLAHVADRDLTTASGKALTLVNPAYMTRQVHEMAADAYGVRAHITSLNPLRPANRPDEWEARALTAFAAGTPEVVGLESIAGQRFLRYMRPMVTEASCLKCHQAQGYALGDIRGGISVSVPFAPYARLAGAQHQSLLLSHLGIAFLGLAGLWVGGQRLKHSEARMRQSMNAAEVLAAKEDLLLSSLGEGVYGIDRDGVCIFINPAALAMLRLAEADVIGRDQHLLFHSLKPDGTHYPHEECPIHLTLQDGLKRDTEDAFVREGGLFPVHLSVTPMRKDGGISGAVVVFQDLSERKRAELEYKTMLQTATDGYVVVDADGRFIDTNEAYCAMVGYGRDELLRMRVVDVEAVESPADERRHVAEIRRAGHARFETRHRRKDGRVIDVEVSTTHLEIRGGVLITFIRDISARKEAELQIRQLAYYDSLTNLPNRRLLADRLAYALAQARRFHRLLAVMFLDLDRFKQVNDSLGHDAGDELLQQVAVRLGGCVRAGDTVARTGGDEFVVVLAEMAHAEDAARVAEKILAVLEAPVTVRDKALTISTSIGIAVYPGEGGEDMQELMRKADLAMYQAKEAGRNGYRFSSSGGQCRDSG